MDILIEKKMKELETRIARLEARVEILETEFSDDGEEVDPNDVDEEDPEADGDCDEEDEEPLEDVAEDTKLKKGKRNG